MFGFGRLDILFDGEHRIMVRVCKRNHSNLDVQNVITIWNVRVNVI